DATSMKAMLPAAGGQARHSLQLTEVHAATLLRSGAAGLPAASPASGGADRPFVCQWYVSGAAANAVPDSHSVRWPTGRTARPASYDGASDGTRHGSRAGLRGGTA